MKTKWIITCVLSIAFTAGAMAQNNLQYFRPYDQSGLNVFETSKNDSVRFDGFKVRIGGSFTQQFQSLDHSNKADSNIVAGVNTNELIELGAGFNLATANLNLDAQLADGVRLSLVTYLSSRHHNEAWVKGGYLQIDKAPFFNSVVVDRIMEFVTLKVGHMEINYGDAHFRRTDNGHALYNPLVGNLIMDAFTTEIGAELYIHHSGVLAMIAATGGEIRGDVTRPDDRSPSVYGKLGYDKQMNDDLRLRLTGSFYTTDKSVNNTLYSGDRAGSRYYLVMENTKATISSNFTSGRFNPGFRSKVTSISINPFVKFHGLEFFGTYEQAEGRTSTETEERAVTQLAGEILYRFAKNEKLFVAGRYNEVSAEVTGLDKDVSITRLQVGAGWFVTRNVLARLEYVTQEYKDFPSSDIRNGGKFDGIMFEGVVAF